MLQSLMQERKWRLAHCLRVVWLASPPRQQGSIQWVHFIASVSASSYSFVYVDYNAKNFCSKSYHSGTENLMHCIILAASICLFVLGEWTLFFINVSVSLLRGCATFLWQLSLLSCSGFPDFRPSQISDCLLALGAKLRSLQHRANVTKASIS